MAQDPLPADASTDDRLMYIRCARAWVDGFNVTYEILFDATRDNRYKAAAAAIEAAQDAAYETLLALWRKSCGYNSVQDLARAIIDYVDGDE